MFTALNQYHVVMEVDPEFWQSPAGLDAIYLRQNPPGAAGSTPAASPSPVAGGGASSTVASAQAAPASTPLSIPTITSPQPTDGPIAAPTPVYPFSLTQVTPPPISTSSPAATPPTSATPIQLISTAAPTPVVTAAVPPVTPASNSTATTGDGGGAAATPTPSPGVVPLSAIARYQPTTAPIAVNHQSQFPAVTISFNLANGMALSDAIAAIQQMQRRVGMPGTVHGTFSGTAQPSKVLARALPILAALSPSTSSSAFFREFIHPVRFCPPCPRGRRSGASADFVSHRTKVIGIIGILLLIGIVKKNAILMVDFALEAERSGGMPPREAIYQACLLRFRPIMMTTVAALFGALPLIMSSGMGSELRRPLGITIAGGLIFSQALTLYTTPVVYLCFDRLRDRWQRRQQPTSVLSDTVMAF